MAWIVQSLNEEWATVANSPAARRALMRWTSRNPALATAHSVDDFVDTRTRPHWGDQALRVLAVEAPDDEIAARTLLQALLGGLVRLATQVAHDDPDAVGEVVSMAWNRIRTYPSQRCGAGGWQRPARRPQGAAPHSASMGLRSRTTKRSPVAASTPGRNARGGGGREGRDRGALRRPGPRTGVGRRAGDDLPHGVGGESLVDVAADMDMSADGDVASSDPGGARLRLLPLAS